MFVLLPFCPTRRSFACGWDCACARTCAGACAFAADLCLNSARARGAFAETRPSRLRFDEGAPCCGACFLSSAPRRLRVSLAAAGFGADDAACWDLVPRRGASGGAACSDTAAVDVAERSPRRRYSLSSSVAHLRCRPEWPTDFPEPGTHLVHSSMVDEREGWQHNGRVGRRATMANGECLLVILCCLSSGVVQG